MSGPGGRGAEVGCHRKPMTTKAERREAPVTGMRNQPNSRPVNGT
jgi:hypothetical protein